jgi:deoxyadenosine/deoxycytidine kinase
MSERDWACYQELYRTLAMLLRPPDLVVYLRASVPTLRRRIEQRGRGYELAVGDDYLAQLHEGYERWVSHFKLAPILTVDTDNLDYVHDEAHLDQISQRIADRLQGRDYLTLG